MHPDQGIADIDPGMGLDRFYGAGMLHPIPGGGGKGASGLKPRDHVYHFQMVAYGGVFFQNDGPV